MKFLVASVRTSIELRPFRFSVRLIGARICSHTSIKGCCSKSIVQLSFLFIVQDLVSFGHFFKFLICNRILLIGIRMILFCQFSVCLLDRIRVCISVHSENLVIILICRHNYFSPFLLQFLCKIKNFLRNKNGTACHSL